MTRPAPSTECSEGVIIAHVLDGLNLGGIDNLAASLIRSFNRKPGIQSYLLSLASAEQLAAEAFLADACLAREFALIPRITWRGLERLILAFKAAKRFGFTAAIIYPFNASLLPAIIGLRLAGVHPLLVHLGNPVATLSPAKEKTHLLSLLFTFLGVALVPCSRYVHASLNPCCLLNRPVEVIPNGCDTQAIHQRARASRAATAGAQKHVVMVARLDDIKDHVTLLKAFAISRLRRPDWSLWLVGDGQNDASLRQLTAELGMNPAEIFLGRRHDIPELLGLSDLFAFATTTAEGFGIALVEAMAAGLPILASDVPACREVLADGAGQLVPAGDVQAWASQLEALMGDADRRFLLSQRSAAAAQRFDLSSTAGRWLALVEP